jgi:2-methylcitrate dehydratase
MSWDRVVEKFVWLAEPFADSRLRSDIVTAIATLDRNPISDLAELLSQASASPQRPRSRGRL